MPNFWGCRCCGRRNQYITNRLLDSSGNVLWSKHVAGTGAADSEWAHISSLTANYALTVHNNDNLKRWSLVDGSVLFGPFDLSSTLLIGSTSRRYDLFVDLDDATFGYSNAILEKFFYLDTDGSTLWEATTPSHNTTIAHSTSSSDVCYGRMRMLRLSPDQTRILSVADFVLASNTAVGVPAREFSEWDLSGNLLWNVLVTGKDNGSGTTISARDYAEYDQDGYFWTYFDEEVDSDDGPSGYAWKFDSTGTVVDAHNGFNIRDCKILDTDYGYKAGSTFGTVLKIEMSTGSTVDSVTLTNSYGVNNINLSVDQSTGLVYVVATKGSSPSISPSRLYCYDADLTLQWVHQEPSFEGTFPSIWNVCANGSKVFIGSRVRQRLGYTLS